jgi:hypothetical protein
MGSPVKYAVLEEAANGTLRWVRLRGFARSEEFAIAAPSSSMTFSTREEAEAHAEDCRKRNAAEVRHSGRQPRRPVRPATYVTVELNRETVAATAHRARKARAAA